MALEDVTAVSWLGSPWVFPHRVVVLLLCSVALEATLKAEILFPFALSSETLEKLGKPLFLSVFCRC